MSTITNFDNLTEVVNHFRDDLTGNNRRWEAQRKKLILLFAHNGTGKTRLSMEFKKAGRIGDAKDTLYFNAFTEDLFVWNNDLENDAERYLALNPDSVFFDGLQELEMENRIGPIFQRYVPLDFRINYEEHKITFLRSVVINGREQTINNIKVSRGEENLFRWCFFLAICQLAIDAEGQDAPYSWVKYFYIDDPISSLDENNVIAVAVDLANMLQEDGNTIKTVVSTHHSLFFNVMFNECSPKKNYLFYFLHKQNSTGYALQNTGDSPFFHHVATLSELKRVVDADEIYTFHFNALRSILEKTASFFGYTKIDKCIHGLENEALFNRALNLMSHGKYSIFDPREMGADNKELFKRVLNGFLDKYEFDLPQILTEETTETA